MNAIIFENKFQILITYFEIFKNDFEIYLNLLQNICKLSLNIRRAISEHSKIDFEIVQN